MCTFKGGITSRVEMARDESATGEGRPNRGLTAITSAAGVGAHSLIWLSGHLPPRGVTLIVGDGSEWC
jgi:hypothetical protein